MIVAPIEKNTGTKCVSFLVYRRVQNFYNVTQGVAM